jgi:hypothetical protein
MVKHLKFLFISSVLMSFLSIYLTSDLWAKGVPLTELNLKDFSDNKDVDLNWDKNPFVQPLKETDISTLRVSMIVYSSDQRSVMINGEVLHEGDRRGGIEVVKIHQKYVILRSDDGIFRLELRGVSVTQKKE